MFNLCRCAVLRQVGSHMLSSSNMNKWSIGVLAYIFPFPILTSDLNIFVKMTELFIEWLELHFGENPV